MGGWGPSMEILPVWGNFHRWKFNRRNDRNFYRRINASRIPSMEMLGKFIPSVGGGIQTNNSTYGCMSIDGKGIFPSMEMGLAINGTRYFHRWKSGSIEILETSLYDLISALFLEKNYKIHIFNFCIFFDVFIYKLFLFVFHTCFRRCEYILTV